MCSVYGIHSVHGEKRVVINTQRVRRKTYVGVEVLRGVEEDMLSEVMRNSRELRSYFMHQHNIKNAGMFQRSEYLGVFK